MLPDFLMQAATEVHSGLKLQDKKLVLAESCTGGLVATLMTSLPGISNFFCGSAVVYRWDTKMKWLGVKSETLENYTDVSCEVASEMALGVLKQTPEASLAASITGHLGPDAPEQQDGKICIGLAGRNSTGHYNEPELIAVDSFHCDTLIDELQLADLIRPELSLRQRRQQQISLQTF